MALVIDNATEETQVTFFLLIINTREFNSELYDVNLRI